MTGFTIQPSFANAGAASPYTAPPPPPPASRVARLHGGEGESEPTGKPKKRRGKRIALTLLFLILAGIIAGGALFLYMYNRVSIPQPSEFALAQATTVYYSDETTELGRFAEINRTVVDINTLPEYVGQAIVASEDRTFFTNSGVDLRGIVRAALNNARGGARQGASTLSQQYVETYFGQETQGYMDKLREAFMALKINRTQEKEEILSNYMNTIYFGRGAYGIEAASEAYFGVPAAELTLSQAALLSGIIPAPSAWDPALDPAQAEARWQRVLNLMAEDGWISEQEAASQTFPETIPPPDGASDMSGWQGYLLQQIRQELLDTGSFTEQDLNEGGLSIISTLDTELQQAAVDSVNVLPEDTPDSVHVALSSVDNETGAILAEYAGSDYQQVQINAVTQEVAQAGSTFKPFALIPFLDKGGSMQDSFDGNSPIDFDGVMVQNSQNAQYGRSTVNEAVEHSINTVFVAVNQIAGPQATMDALIAAGIPQETAGLAPELTNVLGSASPHNIDITRAYATLANGGYRVEPHIVREVRDAKDNVVFQEMGTRESVFSSSTLSAFLPAMLSVTEEGGTASKIAAMGREVGGKTGTSDDFKSAQFAGFIPQVTTSVSMYNVGPGGEELQLPSIGGYDGFYGGDWPVEVWMSYMTKVFAKMPAAPFSWFDPAFVQQPPPEPAPAPAPEPTPTPEPQPEPEPDPDPVEPPQSGD